MYVYTYMFPVYTHPPTKSPCRVEPVITVVATTRVVSLIIAVAATRVVAATHPPTPALPVLSSETRITRVWSIRTPPPRRTRK